MTFEEYYADTFEKWVRYLNTGLQNLEDAEDGVQTIFAGLASRREFCEGLIERGEMDGYMNCAVRRRCGGIRRDRYRQVPTISLDADDVDLLSLLSNSQQDSEAERKAELNDFYGKAIMLLENPFKLSSGCGFETTGELRQYILIQYARNGRTFEEIAKLVGMTHQNISLHYRKIIPEILPAIEEFIGGKLKGSKNDLHTSGD